MPVFPNPRPRPNQHVDVTVTQDKEAEYREGEERAVIARAGARTIPARP